jgi:hypothetical protein
MLLVASLGFGQAQAAGCTAALSLSDVTTLPGTTLNMVTVRMTTNQPTLGVQMDIVDGVPGIYATSCTSLVPGLTCGFNAGGYNGVTRILLYSFNLTQIPVATSTPVARIGFSVASNVVPYSRILHMNNFMVADSINEACRFPGDGVFTVTNSSAFSRSPAKTPVIDFDTALRDLGVVVDDGVPF